MPQKVLWRPLIFPVHSGSEWEVLIPFKPLFHFRGYRSEALVEYGLMLCDLKPIFFFFSNASQYFALGIVVKFCFWYWANLSGLSSISPWYLQKTCGDDLFAYMIKLLKKRNTNFNWIDHLLQPNCQAQLTAKILLNTSLMYGYFMVR